MKTRPKIPTKVLKTLKILTDRLSEVKDPVDFVNSKDLEKITNILSNAVKHTDILSVILTKTALKKYGLTKNMESLEEWLDTKRRTIHISIK